MLICSNGFKEPIVKIMHFLKLCSAALFATSIGCGEVALSHKEGFWTISPRCLEKSAVAFLDDQVRGIVAVVHHHRQDGIVAVFVRLQNRKIQANNWRVDGRKRCLENAFTVIGGYLQPRSYGSSGSSCPNGSFSDSIDDHPTPGICHSRNIFS